MKINFQYWEDLNWNLPVKKKKQQIGKKKEKEKQIPAYKYKWILFDFTHRHRENIEPTLNWERKVGENNSRIEKKGNIIERIIKICPRFVFTFTFVHIHRCTAIVAMLLKMKCLQL